MVTLRPYWKHARKLCLMELFTTKRLECYEHIRVDEMNNMLKNIFKSSGKSILLKDYLSTLGLNVISYMVLGNKYSHGYDDVVSSKEFKKMLEELFHLSAVFNVGDMIPYLSFLDLQGYVKRMKIVGKKFDKFLEHALNEHEETRMKQEKYSYRAFVDVLLDMIKDPNSEVKLERDGVKAFIQVGGYDIKKGTQVMINVWTIGRDPSIWEIPDDFCPERFIGRDIDVTGQDFELLPFGSGRRMCPGYGLGLKLIQSSLANLLHGFNWKLSDNLKPEDLNMEEIFGLSTPRKIPLEVVVEPRLYSL